MKPLNKLFPDFEQFSNSFTSLTLTKNEKPSNVKTKYVLQKSNYLMEDVDFFSDDGSIEHIVSETEGESTFNIGNLILLEEKLNVNAVDLNYNEEKNIYKKSSYPWVNKFIQDHESWEIENIQTRA